jgi:hypothetical protein
MAAPKPDEAIDGLLLRAFTLGWNVAIEAHDCEPLSPALWRMHPLLREIASGERTVQMSADEVIPTLLRQFPAVRVTPERQARLEHLAETHRQMAKRSIADDRALAGRILRAAPGPESPAPPSAETLRDVARTAHPLRIDLPPGLRFYLAELWREGQARRQDGAPNDENAHLSEFWGALHAVALYKSDIPEMMGSRIQTVPSADAPEAILVTLPETPAKKEPDAGP